MSSPRPGSDERPEAQDEVDQAPTCPSCGRTLRWMGTEMDVEGGWWQCGGGHRWRLRQGEFVAFDAA